MERQKNADTATLGDIVRIARHNKNLTQEVLAERIGVCKKTIIDIENNIGNPRFDVLNKLVRELELPLCQIFYPNEDIDSEWKNKILQEIRDCSDYEIKVIVLTIASLKAALREENKNKTKE